MCFHVVLMSVFCIEWRYIIFLCVYRIDGCSTCIYCTVFWLEPRLELMMRQLIVVPSGV